MKQEFINKNIENVLTIIQNTKKELDKHNLAKIYGSWIFNETAKYQKLYGFEIGKGEHSTHNNESDAFKHAFMQAHLSLLLEKHIAYIPGLIHEIQGDLFNNQPKPEKIMDNWNNYQGREIASEVKSEFQCKYGKYIGKNAYNNDIKDSIARKIIERMNAGELILDPSGRRMPRHKLINRSSTKKGCAGTYHVNGYKRADGTEVSDYYRTCGALHKSLDGVDIRFAAEKLSDNEIKAGRAKYAGKRYQDLTRVEQLDAIKYFV